MRDNLKLAIVYDWIDKWGGVERVLLTLHEMFPHADFYTSYVDRNSAAWSKNISIQSSFIQKLPDLVKKNRVLSIPLYPLAFESFNFNSYDVVISVTSSFAKAIITKPSTLHLCYLLTPTRFLWTHADKYVQNAFQKLITNPLKNYLLKWDLVASQRPDMVISLSESVKKRCEIYYKRESTVIYPPFDTEYWTSIKSQITNHKSQINNKFQITNNKNYFLLVSRLEPYKRVDLAIEVFNKLSETNLIIVGKGSEEKKLKKTAEKNIQFIPYVSEEELGFLYSNAEALIMPQEEDFGYVALEAQFFGCPVIAFGKGGASETILPYKTGLFFPVQNIQSLIKALEEFHTMSYNLRTSTCRWGVKNVERFNKQRFITRLESLISNIKDQKSNLSSKLKTI